MAKNKKTSYVAKLIRVMDEGELGMTDKWLRKDALKKNYYGKGSNRINELHDSLSDRTNELARIIDIHLVKPLSLTIGNNTDKEINDDNSKLIE